MRLSSTSTRWLIIALLGVLWEVAPRAGWIAELFLPPLTTTLTRRFEMGCRAGAAILDRLAGIEVPKISDLGFELIPGATA